jgi:SAM-dependent methyltransferase
MSVTGTENLEVMKEAVKYNAYLASLVRHAAPPGGRVLDFGAGLGTFAGILAAEGYAVVCVEPDANALARLARNQDIEAHATIDEIPPLSVDGAYSLNVLEHVADDFAALLAMRERIRRGGTLVLYVPAFPILFSAMDRRVDHLRRYRKARLKELVSAAGFSISRATYVDSLGFFAALAYRIAGNRDGDIDRLALKFYDRFLFPVSRLLDLVCGPFFGKNLLVQAVRP